MRATNECIHSNMLCRYNTLKIKSVLRLPVHGIVIEWSYAWVTHRVNRVRSRWRTVILNDFKLRIACPLKEDIYRQTSCLLSAYLRGRLQKKQSAEVRRDTHPLIKIKIALSGTKRTPI